MAELIDELYYNHNGKIMEASDFSKSCEPTYPSVYEVLRIMNGVPLFLEEHYRRLVNSLASIHQTIDLSLEELRAQIIALTEACHIQNHNIKLIMYGFDKGQAEHLFLYFIPTHYPDPSMYETGVATELLHAERKNPQAKIINQSLRDTANAQMAAHNLFEVLLVNDRGEITEGSRSNLFFIKGDTLYTSPAEGVLPGITLQRILRVCEENQVPVCEAPIRVSELDTYDAAFISGTSPKVLPIRTIGELTLDVQNPVLRRVMELYNAEISRYLLRSLS